jgi:two-component system sensor histidine kinase TtrS
MLQSKKGRSEDFPEAMRQISAQSQRAGKIIRQMREFTRKTEVRLRSVDINALVGEMAEFITGDMRHQEIELRLELGGELPQVIADPIQVQQVVLNLIRNAVEAMQGSAIGHRVLRIRTSLVPEHVEVTVSDTGSGLPQEIRDRLFHPFLTTKPEGMGLGLSISHSIIEMHKGKLWATPRDGGGTNFHFTLPAAQTRA